MKEEPIPLFKVFMNEEVDKNIVPVLKSGYITQGKKVEELEELLKKWFNHPYILTLNSATSGLTLAYRLVSDIQDTKYDVISTPLTCFATNAAILTNQSYNIIWADTDPNTCNIDLDDVKKKITEKTRVLTFVHWGGTVVNLDKIEELKIYTKEKFGNELYVIEDCAHAFGAEFNNKKLGTHGNICIFSLQAIKHLTTGDGGLIFLPNEEMYNKAKLLRWFGIDRDRRSLPGTDFRLEPDIPEYGYKFHMNDINASIGLANFPFIENILEKCRVNGKYYNENLKNIFGIELFKENINSIPSYWIYTLKILYDYKNEFMNFMKEKGIVVSQVHARNDNHSCLSKYKSVLSNLDSLESKIISIPVGWWLSCDQKEYIVNCIKEFSKKLPLKIETLQENDINAYKELLFQLNNWKEDHYINNPIKNNDIYVLKENGKIVATAKLLVEEKLYANAGHIEDVVCDYNYRCKGYTKILIQHLTKFGLEEYGCYKIVLHCKEDLEKFYTKCGLNKTGFAFSIYKNPKK